MKSRDNGDRSPSQLMFANAAHHGDSPLVNTVSPFEEMLAYETLWGQRNQTLKRLATLFKTRHVLPSQLLSEQADLLTPELTPKVRQFLESKRGFSVSVHGDYVYPEKLQEAKYPIELFYYKGEIALLETRCISVVGSRKCSQDGERRTRKLVTELVRHGITIVSGLALGVDTIALSTALSEKGRVVGVIGTPIDEYYPRENKPLQDVIAKEHLLISQVPFYRYATEPFQSKRNYFPQRNETMSALSEATIIVEASDTSGTLTQARACLAQKRKLFILNSAFERKDIKWPTKFLERGAVRVRDMEDILVPLGLK
jgi:DNA processing protein